jgi:hypothetical protein
MKNILVLMMLTIVGVTFSSAQKLDCKLEIRNNESLSKIAEDDNQDKKCRFKALNNLIHNVLYTDYKRVYILSDSIRLVCKGDENLAINGELSTYSHMAIADIIHGVSNQNTITFLEKANSIIENDTSDIIAPATKGRLLANISAAYDKLQ